MSRKPLGKVWCGNWLHAEEMLGKYGLRNLKELHRWLGRVIAWAEFKRGKAA